MSNIFISHLMLILAIIIQTKAFYHVKALKNLKSFTVYKYTS